ncbi:cytochrome P450 [Nocardia aurea]|uniref:cytochrome P450 n=1 Tax=Nocardia aurea TaxID=2144174 RepID=UPI000D68B837|nr:cytochrome P450 [Nocardia aurea]
MKTQSTAADLAAEARLNDPAFFLGDPYPTYQRLRREAPVFWCEAGQFWALSKHEDIAWVELRPNPPFTTTQGLHIPEAARTDRIGERDPGGAQQTGVSFMSDPPTHTAFRRLLGTAFTPKLMIDLEPRVRSIVNKLLDQLPAGEPVDFVDAVSVPLAVQVIGEFLGVAEEEWDNLGRWTDSFMGFIGGGLAEGEETANAAKDMQEMYAFFIQSLADRKQNPRDDLMSKVTKLEMEGEPLSEASQLGICFSVLAAGNETTRNTLSGSMVAFAEHPGQWAKLVENPALAQGATEELLRWVSPVTHFGRRATEPVVIRGQEIAEGDFVAMLYGAANRDEDVWENANEFDITRKDAHKHLSFGWGLHRCIGLALGRAEIRITLEGLAERFSSWEIPVAPTRNPSVLVNDYKSVPVVLRRR